MKIWRTSVDALSSYTILNGSLSVKIRNREKRVFVKSTLRFILNGYKRYNQLMSRQDKVDKAMIQSHVQFNYDVTNVNDRNLAKMSDF